MARPKSEEKRDALFEAAIRVFDAQGLSAPTSLIAREAGVANGTLFNYFPTKADLFNQLYLKIKGEMAGAIGRGIPTGPLREQLRHGWRNWMTWAIENQASRRVLILLVAADELTAETKEEGARAMAKVAMVVNQVCAEGPLREAPRMFIVSMTDAMAEATISSMLRFPDRSEELCDAGFDALWRVVAGDSI